TEDGGLRIGAGERLATVAADPRVRRVATALAEAAGAVAHPQARNMGTLGGNICLDVRCRYVNRTPLWRGALGGCLKAEGDRCHVVPGGRLCVAALSGDTVAPLVALGAEAEIASPAGRRRVPVAALRNKDGRQPLTLAADDIVVAVHLPAPAPDQRSAYCKWALRNAVDFPLVSLAVVARLDDHGILSGLRIAAGALGPRPKRIDGFDDLDGRPLTRALAAEIADRAVRRIKPLPNVLHDPAHRRRIAGVILRRRLEAWIPTKD
ncbi:MAG: 4-hydroxybenzoyl-CoA reductase subunit beta, partial [Deltaproteobacteria bacterium]